MFFQIGLATLSLLIQSPVQPPPAQAPVAHPALGTLRQLGCPIKIDGATPRYEPGAALGADTAAVLAEVGVDAAELARLRTLGAI